MESSKRFMPAGIPFIRKNLSSETAGRSTGGRYFVWICEAAMTANMLNANATLKMVMYRVSSGRESCSETPAIGPSAMAKLFDKPKYPNPSPRYLDGTTSMTMVLDPIVVAPNDNP